MQNLVSCPSEVSYLLKTIDKIPSVFDKENNFREWFNVF